MTFADFEVLRVLARKQSIRNFAQVADILKMCVCLFFKKKKKKKKNGSFLTYTELSNLEIYFG